jgi:MiaB/RimO family radical SAM methylthiotransferase
LTLGDFVQQSRHSRSTNVTEPRQNIAKDNPPLTFHIKTYGCQMNVSDSDIVRAVMLENGYKELSPTATEEVQEVIVQQNSGHLQAATTPDILLTNTCAIREKAEDKVWQRLRHLRKHRSKKQIVGVLGCMAERLQEKLLAENMADVVVGPDQYRQLPELLQSIVLQQRQQQAAEEQEKRKQQRPQAMNVELSLQETYDDIIPVRDEASNPFSAFVSIQRGCSNRCSFCIVPFTRGGQERSRPFQSIVDEVSHLVERENLKEVVLLGQNVNSYHDRSPQAMEARPETTTLPLSNEGFRSRIRRPEGGGYRFVDLVEAVSDISPELRVRFTSPHPKDYPSDLLYLMAERPNVCSQLHMPAQSGSTSMLRRMKRGYSRDAYMELIDTVKNVIPDVALSSDFIAGFCDETEEEHADTVSLLEYVEYEQAFLFAYSMREKTHANRTMEDNVPAPLKQRRLQELIDVFRERVHAKNVRVETGHLRLVLVEGPTKKQSKILESGCATWHGRTDQNKRVLFSVNDVQNYDDFYRMTAQAWNEQDVLRILEQQQQFVTSPSEGSIIAPLSNTAVGPGDYAVVYITEAKGHTLRGRLLWKTNLADFHRFELKHLSSRDQDWLDIFKESLLQCHDVRLQQDDTPLAAAGQ